jgi:hypothetical protein
MKEAARCRSFLTGRQGPAGDGRKRKRQSIFRRLGAVRLYSPRPFQTRKLLIARQILQER